MEASFIPFHSLFFVLWLDHFKWCFFRFTSSFLCLTRLLLMVTTEFLISFIVLCCPRFLFDSFCGIYPSHKILMCLCVFIISLHCLSLFSCSSLSFFKTNMLNYLSGISHFSISLGLITGKLLWFWWWHISLIFHVPLSNALLSLCWRKQSLPPVFNDWHK